MPDTFACFIDLDWVSKLLTLWVALAMAIGLLISHFAPEVRAPNSGHV
jgi:ACR3 family arsenite efflux pump ArsB